MKKRVLIISHKVMSGEILALAARQIKGISDVENIVDKNNSMVEIDRYLPHIILFDFSMDHACALSKIKKIKNKYSKIKILVIDSNANENKAKRLIGAGVDGYVHLDEKLKYLTKAITLMLQGEKYIDPILATELVVDGIKDRVNIFDQLTDREYEVLCMLLKGSNMKKIADQLKLQQKTVSFHLRSAYKKTKITTQNELLFKAVKCGLITVQ